MGGSSLDSDHWVVGYSGPDIDAWLREGAPISHSAVHEIELSVVHRRGLGPYVDNHEEAVRFVGQLHRSDGTSAPPTASESALP